MRCSLPSMANRRISRARSRGLSTVQTILAVAAVMGCFVYPLSVAIRGAGAKLAADCEHGHETVLRQAR